QDVEIGKLIQYLKINDWVDAGRDYLQQSKTCPFCQKNTITQDFRAQLADYFDESYSASINKIDSLSEEYDRLSSSLLDQLNEIEKTQKNLADSKLDVDV